jgi:3-oxoacyl-[acyl-carrier-protein] synthase II
VTTGRIRVAVTGIGVKTPAGNDVGSMVDALRAGLSTARTVDGLVEAAAPVTFACPVPEFDIAAYCTRRDLRRMDRAALLALAAAVDAVAAATIDWPSDPTRVGVALGTGMGGLAATEEGMRSYGAALANVPAYSAAQVMANSAAARLAIRFGIQGPVLTYAASCASGAVAIGEAALKIRYGELDLVLAGGVDSAITPAIMTTFANAGALSRRNDAPGNASRPFDADRDGFVMGEGAAILVLERWDRAAARGAPILGELAGYCSNSDAFHIVAPLGSGAMAADCMRQAVSDAGVSLADIGHVNAHGTSTVLNDRAEALALTACFGDRCPPVTAPKGVIGHLVGGAGAVEAAITLTIIENGVVPPIANFTKTDIDGAVDLVNGEPRVIDRSPGLSNSFGFGGHNACLVLLPR